MFVTIRLRETLPLMAALALILAALALPPLGAEPAAAAAFSPSGNVLIIDAGHGGADGGAVAADGTVESEINLAVAVRLKQLAGLFGAETLMTRESEGIAYPEDAGSTAEMKRADQHARLELINSCPEGVLISIHQNFYPDSRPSGAQVFYAAYAGSEEFGKTAHELLKAALCPESRRVAAPRLRTSTLCARPNAPQSLSNVASCLIPRSWPSSRAENTSVRQPWRCLRPICKAARR